MAIWPRIAAVIAPGSELGDFVIESIAGRGGMGVVYRARQRQPSRVVALKVISSELAEDEQFRARFEREAAIAAQIEHPNVIPVHAVGEVDGTLYIAMRFVDGVDLRALLIQQGRLEPRRAAMIVDQVAQALDAAHAQGLVHRDVKPANVLISASGGREHVYLSDFGLSRHIVGSTALTSSGAFIGTVDYMAPEQARGERVDARADVYSLGCVLFQALTGSVPFPLDNDLAKLYAHDSQPPPSILDRASDLPPAFDSVLTRALAKAPEERYLSAGDLGRAALAASSGSMVSRSERSVATGAAAPPDARPVSAAPRSKPPLSAGAAKTAAASAAERARLPPSRRVWWGVAIAAALAVAAALVAVLAGGSSMQTTSTLSLTPIQAQAVPPIRGKRPLQTVGLTARAGYAYRAELATVDAPAGASASAPLPLYLTLRARRGAMPFVIVEQLQLPSQWRWTSSSLLSSFTLDPNPDGTGQLALSWFVKAGDRTDVTHYLTVGPQGIQIDS